MKINLSINILLILTLICNFLLIDVYALENDSSVTEITLYYMTETDKEYYSNYIAIPDNFTQSYQITLDGNYENVSYKAQSDDNKYLDSFGNGISTAYVDENGLITVRGKIEFQGIVFFDGYQDGENTITVTADNNNYIYKVKTVNYVDYYINNIINTYIDENITYDMSQYEKLEKVCQFVANFNYSAEYSSMEGMILSSGGDCWSSTETVNHMCNLLGIHARKRSSNVKDSSVGAGHKNSLIIADGKSYIVDCGYNEKAPRFYSIRELKNEYRYSILDDDTIKIIEYCGNEENIIIPDTIDGHTVSVLGDYSFENCYEATSIYIPDTVVEIGQSAFYNCSSLEEMVIPESVDYIDAGLFESCSSLNEVIFPKKVIEMSTNAMFHNCSALKSVVFPEGVLEIEDFCFDHCYNLENVVMSDTIIDIRTQAFAHCSSLKDITISRNLQSISGGFVFYNCSELKSIIIPGTIQYINAYAFQRDLSVGKCLEDVYYCGTEEQWTELTKNMSMNISNVLSSASIHYNFVFPQATEIKIGDVDGNNIVDAVDASMVLVEYAQLSTENDSILNDEQRIIADVNGDGLINAVDSSIILEIYAYNSTVNNF